MKVKGKFPKYDKFVDYLKSQTKSQASIKSRVHDMVLFFREFDKLNTNTAREFIKRQIEAGKDPNTVMRRAGSLRKYAECFDIPLAKIHVPSPKQKIPEIISDVELTKLYNDAMKITKEDGFDMMTVRTMIILLNYLIRRQGILDVKNEDIDFNNKFIKIKNKGGNEIIKPLVFGYDELKEYVEMKKEMGIDVPYLLVRKYNNRWKRLEIREMYKMLYDFTIKSIGKKVKPHSFRHSIATSMLEKGADLRGIQDALDHKRIQTTQIYTQVSRKYNRYIMENFHPIKGS